MIKSHCTFAVLKGIYHQQITLSMTIDKNLQEYLIEVTVKDTNLQSTVDKLIQTGFKLDKNFRPKLLKVKSNSNQHANFLIKGMLSRNASNLLKTNRNVTNFWQSSGTIPF